jgi:hypothetical protein
MTGFDSKRQMAADKLWDKPSVAFDEWWNSDNDESTNPFRLESGAYWAWAGWKAALAQPAQEPVAHFGSAYVNENGVHITTVLGPVAIPQDAKLYTTPPHPEQEPMEREWNFCERCGKRTKDLTVIHTCTPPQEKTND